MEKISATRLMTLLLMLLVAGGYTMVLRHRDVPPAPPPDLGLIPSQIGGMTAVEEYIGPESLRMLGADTTLARSYSGAGGQVDLFLGYFARQQEDSQIHSPKHCYPGSGWNIIRESSTRISLETGSIDARELLISDGRERQLVIYWFSMPGRTIQDEFSLKYHQMRNALLARPQSAAFVRFSSRIGRGDEETARDRLRVFIEEISPYIQDALSPRT